MAEHANPAWLGTLEAVDPEALRLLHDYAIELATLWVWAYEAMDGAAHGGGQAELRTYQRFGDPTANRVAQRVDADGEPLGPPALADTAAVVLRARCRQEAKRIRDATGRLRRELDGFAAADQAGMEAERQRWEHRSVS